MQKERTHKRLKDRNKINKNQEREGSRETLWRAEQEEEEKGQSWEPKLFPGISMLWGHCCPRIYMKPRSWLTQKKGKAPLKSLNLRKLGLPMTKGHSHFLGPTLLSPKHHPISCSDSLMQTPPSVVLFTDSSLFSFAVSDSVSIWNRGEDEERWWDWMEENALSKKGSLVWCWWNFRQADWSGWLANAWWWELWICDIFGGMWLVWNEEVKLKMGGLEEYLKEVDPVTGEGMWD